MPTPDAYDPDPAAYPPHGSAERVAWEDTVPPGAYWTRIIPRWATLRITDLEGAGAASLLAYNADQPSEGYIGGRREM